MARLPEREGSMVGRRVYDLMYRYWAPWDSVGVRAELQEFLDAGVVAPATHPRAIDLGCGTGHNVVFLAEQGFDAFGVDFSEVALEQGRQRAADAGVTEQTTFVEADLTAESIPGVDGQFDFLVDFGTLDDLRPPQRRQMADLMARLCRPGGVVLFWCFYQPKSELPWISFNGASRMAPAIDPGEEQRLFGDAFDIDAGPQTSIPDRARCFVMTRR